MKALYLIAIYLLTACKGVHPDSRDATFASYFVSIDDNNPYSAQVSLTLENNGETPTRLISRAQSLGTTSQIKDVK